ncbi:MAG: adenine phosphoribosyltransferase [Planctomycetes bacterium]|nr:adenine phosphoribosyltransferase [Planctomycetota bacterium]
MAEHDAGWLREKVRDVPDFPKPGIIFKDITPVLKDAPTLRRVTAEIAGHLSGRNLNGVVGIESRGFIFGATVAYEMGLPFHMVRKPGKLPAATVQADYDLEYGSNTLHIHADALRPGDRVAIIDDLLATGGTVSAACQLVERLRGAVAACVFVIELSFLGGRGRLGKYDVFSLLAYEREQG